MNKYPMKPMADEMAKRGRYGDSMLVHMNPAEVEGIAALSPTGKLTINPDTGQPEAFLPFLAPLIGSALGSSFIPGLAASAGIGGIGAGLGGAIGSGLANWAATGDLEKGLMAGLTGYGIGSAMGAAGAGAQGAAAQGVKNAASTTAEGITANATDDLIRSAGSQAAEQAAQAATPSVSQALSQGASSLGTALSSPGALAKGAMTPQAMIPASTGLGMLAEEDRIEAAKNAQIERDRQAGRDRMADQQFFDRNLRYAQDTFPAAGNPYDQNYADGGITGLHPDSYRRMRSNAVSFATGGKAPALINQNYGLPGGGGVNAGSYGLPGGGLPAQRQASLRGPYVNAPPEEYRPGFDPEFLYFSQEPTDVTINPPAESPELPGIPQQPDIPQGVLDRYELLIGPTDLPGKDARRKQDFLSEVSSLREQYPGLYQVDERLGDRIHRDTPQWQDYGGIDANTYGGVTTMPVGGASDVVDPYTGGIAGLRGPRNIRVGMANGGMTLDPMDMEEVTMAIRGEIDGAEEVIESFTQKYGPEVFEQVREQVLQTVSPGAQTDGMLEGEGTGMEDGIGALIGSSQKAAVSPGEYIIPADVVSGLGDGSSDAGADRLEELIARVRQSRTGTTDQPAPVDEQQVMPA